MCRKNFIPTVRASSHPTPTAPLPPGPLAGRTFLLVEDESFIAELLVKWLARLGAKTYWAQNATKGIELFKDHTGEICTVIADFRLPDMDGCDMCSRLRELKPRLPVLLTSGRYQGAAEQALLNTGPTDFIQKPYPLDAALEKLQKLLVAV